MSERAFFDRYGLDAIQLDDSRAARRRVPGGSALGQRRRSRGRTSRTAGVSSGLRLQPRLPDRPLRHRHASQDAVDGAAGRWPDDVGGGAPAEGEARHRDHRRVRAGAALRRRGRRGRAAAPSAIAASCAARSRDSPSTASRAAGRTPPCSFGIEELILETYEDPAWVAALLGVLRDRKLAFAALDGRRAVRPAGTRRRRRLVDRHLAEDLRPLRRAVRRAAHRGGARGRPAHRLPHVRRDDAAPRADCRHGARRDGDVHAEGRWAATRGSPRPSGASGRACA